MQFVYADPILTAESNISAQPEAVPPPASLPMHAPLPQANTEVAAVSQAPAQSPRDGTTPYTRQTSRVQPPPGLYDPQALAQYSEMSEMVNNLVDEGDGAIPTNANMPPTPPEQTFDDTAMMNDSTYGITSLNLGDSFAWGQNYNPRSSAVTARSPSHDSRGSISPAPIPPLSSIPHLPDESGIFAAFSAESPSDPSSPYLRTAPAGPDSPAQYLNRRVGHSRQNSRHSSRGSIDPWVASHSLHSPTYHSTYNPMSASEPMLSSLPQSSVQHLTYIRSVPGHPGSGGMSHPAFYGSPWNSEHASSVFRTPPNGQGNSQAG